MFLLLFCFSLFAVYEKVSNFMFTDNKVDIFKEDLEEIAFYFWNFDRDLSHIILKLDDVVQGYLHGENILVDDSDKIDDIWQYVNKNKSYLAKL